MNKRKRRKEYNGKIFHIKDGLSLFFVWSLLVLLFPINLQAQSPTQWAKLGKMSWDQGDWYGAITYYNKAYRADTTRLDHLTLLADAYRMNNNYREAANAYGLIYENRTSEKYAMTPYWWAKMLQSMAVYDSAVLNYERFINYESVADLFFKRDAKQQIASCEWAAQHLSDTLDFSYSPLEITGNYSDFGGTLLNDSTLLYASLNFTEKDSSLERSKKELEKKVNIYSGIYNDTNWKKGPFLDSLFASEQHLGNACFYPDSNWLIYTECSDYGKCILKLITYENGTWSDPEALPNTINLEGFTTTQPYLTTLFGKMTLFFVSDRPQGRGKLDIWYSVYDTRLKGFKYPRNMGRNVNTPGNDITPFVPKDSTQLFFSSDWHKGFGGYDVFVSQISSLRSLNKPTNVQQPTNSPTNDLYYWSVPQRNLFFVSSNREGGKKMEGQTCCNDIYMAHFTPPDTSISDSVPPIVHLVDTLPDTTTVVELPPQHTEPKITLLDFHPVLYFDNDYPDPRSTATTTKSTYRSLFEAYQNQRSQYQNQFDSVATAEQLLTSDSAQSLIQHFFDHKIKKGITELDAFCSELLKTLKKGQSVKITIKGYASPLASSSYNINLSRRRIQSIVNHLAHYESDALTPYIDSKAENKAQLIIVRQPYGESKSANFTKLELSNTLLSIFSPSAMQERRVEIIKVDLLD